LPKPSRTFFGTTQEEKREWQPSFGSDATTTRSALQQVGECVVVNGYMAKLIRGEELTPVGSYEMGFASVEEAKTLLLESANALAEAIRTLPDANLEGVYQHPRGQILGKNVIIMPLRNMAYHAGQINFIQTLYGDTEFHVPPTWR